MRALRKRPAQSACQTHAFSDKAWLGHSQTKGKIARAEPANPGDPLMLRSRLTIGIAVVAQPGGDTPRGRDGFVGLHRQPPTHAGRTLQEMRVCHLRRPPAHLSSITAAREVHALILRRDGPLHDLDGQHRHDAISAPFRIETGRVEPKIPTHRERE
jgi:hypothetical protein